jgi:hypothetical protein
VAVVWAAAGDNPKPLQLGNLKMQVWDLVGRPQAARTFTSSETPVYIVGKGLSGDEFEKALAVSAAEGK